MLEVAEPEPAGQKTGRKLEIVVLAARSLRGEGRRKVQLTLVGPRDPEGEAFGAKVSPWTDAARGGKLLFGQRGLRCSFPLDTSLGAPSLAADVRFADATQLRVRLLVSMLPSQNPVFKAAAKFLPSSLADGVSNELDEATAAVEAEGLIPLANILSGRSGFAADRALGGWVPLRLLLQRPEAAPGGEEEPPLSLWMQMYALPDHEEWLPRLRQQLEEELPRHRSGPRSPGEVQWLGLGGEAAAPARQPAPARPRPAPRWGPAAGRPEARAAGAAAAPDLIDVSLDDGPELLGPEVEPAEPAVFDLLGGDATLPRLAAAECSSFGTGTAADLLGSSEPAPLAAGAAGGGSGSSAFSFIRGGSPGTAETISGAATAAGADGPSAFGFIAGSSNAQLDLAALYGSGGLPGGAAPRPVPLPEQSLSSAWNSKFAPLAEAAPQRDAQNSDPFKSLEADILAGLR